MATRTVIVEQPQAQGVETNYLDPAAELEELNPEVVLGWGTEEVCAHFLYPLNMGHLDKLFKKHNITGAVLMSLSKRDLKDMNIWHVGDRLYIDQSLEKLRVATKRVERERVIWRAKWPEGGVAYFKSTFECIMYKCCPCCKPQIEYKITSQGLTKWYQAPVCCPCKGQVSDFEDFRLLKDIDWRDEKNCCCPRRVMIMRFENDKAQNSITAQVAHENATNGTVVEESADSRLTTIVHPGINPKLVEKIKHAWFESKLVAD